MKKSPVYRIVESINSRGESRFSVQKRLKILFGLYTLWFDEYLYGDIDYGTLYFTNIDDAKVYIDDKRRQYEIDTSSDVIIQIIKYP